MRFSPDVVRVPAGDRLVVVLVNTGDDRDDLVLETGARTPRVGPGDRASVDAGVVGRDLDGWCSVAGHRQMGMVLRVVVGDAVPEATGTGHTASDARLAPAPAATVHRVALEVREVDLEVAPGVVRRRWTFNGTSPGPTLRGKVGDVFEVTLVNRGTIGHSIDVHAGHWRRTKRCGPSSPASR